MPAKSSVTSKGRLGQIGDGVRRLVKQELLVGVPDSTAERQPEPGEKGTPPSNAVIGYTQEFGDDDLRIPPRPFLVPGVENAKPEIVAALKIAGAAIITGSDLNAVEKGFNRAGLAAVASVKDKMMSGPFAPLSPRTIEARATRRNPETGKLKGDKPSREARQFLKLQGEGVPDDVLHGAGLAQPLLDTRSLFKGISYVVRDKA